VVTRLIEVYYDGKCGVCRKEINYYRSIMPADIFIWRDLFQHQEMLNAAGISFTESLMALHANDASGHWHKGVDAFIIIWRYLPKWHFRFLAKLLSLPLLHAISCWGYDRFAKFRFKKNGYCDL